MTLKSWSRKFAAVCGIISALAAGGLQGQTAGNLPAATTPKPAIVLPDPRDAATWKKWTDELGWQLIAPDIAPNTDADGRAAALADAARAAIKSGSADPSRIYLAGRGADVPLVFYIVSRVPDLWAAAFALGGSPAAALASGRVYAANFTDAPVLWVSEAAGDSDLAARLKAAGLNVDWREAKTLTIAQSFATLEKYTHAEFPPVADCETNTERFASCYWLEPVRFDPGERNDVLPKSRVLDGSGASLDLGGFGYRITDPGPGALISSLPKDYFGPLQIGDRIVELDGTPIADAKDFNARMNKMYAEKEVVAMIARGKERLRVPTRVVLPSPDSYVTSRVQGKYDAQWKTIQILSRSISELRVRIPAEWLPADLYWNGLEMENLTKPGCYRLTVDKELLDAAPCSQ